MADWLHSSIVIYMKLLENMIISRCCVSETVINVDFIFLKTPVSQMSGLVQRWLLTQLSLLHGKSLCPVCCQFYLHNAVHSVVHAGMKCFLSVTICVVLYQNKKQSVWLLHHSNFQETELHCEIMTGSPLTGAADTDWIQNIYVFDRHLGNSAVPVFMP